MIVNRLIAGLLLMIMTVALYGSEAEEIRRQLPSLKGKDRLDALGRLYDYIQADGDFEAQLSCLNEYLAEAHRQGNSTCEAEARGARIILFYNNLQNDSVLRHAHGDLDYMLQTKEMANYYRVWSYLVNTYVYDGSVTIGLQEAEKMYADANGTTEFVEMIPNAPIGLWPGLEYEGEEIADITGRPLFVYTDGLNEAENRQQEQFTDERLLQILETTPFESARQTVELLKAEVEKHRDGAEPNDDLTMLCVEVKRTITEN